jgi:hypothetical protein
MEAGTEWSLSGLETADRQPSTPEIKIARLSEGIAPGQLIRCKAQILLPSGSRI